MVYEDLNGNLWLYKNGEKIALSNFSASFWDVKDDLVVWMENSYFFAYTNDAKMEVCTYKPSSYLLKNNTLVYSTILGGVNALVDGKTYEITNIQHADYEIYGNNVLVKLPNKTSVVFYNGKRYTN
mgnify:CR=1 FL=1